MQFVNANRRLVLGVSGAAGAGKDTFCKILQRHVNIRRYSLGDILKHEVREDCLEKYGIDPTNCTRKEKNSIRDYLVEYGSKKREETNGRYFIDKLSKELLGPDGNVKESVIITDIRYDEYSKDEVHWLKEELLGFLVHVQRYKIKNNHHIAANQPANEDEERNLPKMMSKRDFLINMETFYELNEYELHQRIDPLVLNLIEVMKSHFAKKRLRITLP